MKEKATGRRNSRESHSHSHTSGTWRILIPAVLNSTINNRKHIPHCTACTAQYQRDPPCAPCPHIPPRPPPPLPPPRPRPQTCKRLPPLRQIQRSRVASGLSARPSASLPAADVRRHPLRQAAPVHTQSRKPGRHNLCAVRTGTVTLRRIPTTRLNRCPPQPFLLWPQTHMHTNTAHSAGQYQSTPARHPASCYTVEQGNGRVCQTLQHSTPAAGHRHTAFRTLESTYGTSVRNAPAAEKMNAPSREPRRCG